MKYALIITLLTVALTAQSQNLRPESIHASYFGETITHPGIKVGVDYALRDWDKTKIKRSGNEKLIRKTIDFSPNIGFYYHQDFHSGLFFLPELSYSRKNEKGNSITLGVGAGYMRTIIPNVYELNSNNEIKKISSGNHYLLTNYSIRFTNDLDLKSGKPISIFIKPQLIFASPSYLKSDLYLAVELGVIYQLSRKDEK